MVYTVHAAEEQKQPKCKVLSAGYGVLQATACTSLLYQQTSLKMFKVKMCLRIDASCSL